MTAATPDVELWDRWRAGDQRAGKALFERHAPAVLRFFRAKVPESAEDLTQEVFMRFLRAAAIETAPRAFLFGIARNVMRETFKRRRPDFDDSITAVADVDAASSTHLHARRSLLTALQVLPFDLQVTIELHYWEGFTSEELAAVLGISASSARTRLTVARERLRASLSKRFPKRPASDFDDLERWAAMLRDSVK